MTGGNKASRSVDLKNRLQALDHPGGPNVITGIFGSGRGRQERLLRERKAHQVLIGFADGASTQA